MFFDVPPVRAMPGARNPSDRMEEVRKSGAPCSSARIRSSSHADCSHAGLPRQWPHAETVRRFVAAVHARIGGLLYLLIIAAGLFAEFVRERFVVPGNAAATASHIRDHAFMFRLGLAADLSTFVCAIAVAVILYVLLRPVNRHAALLMLAFSLVQDAIGGLNALNTYRPCSSSRAAYLKAFSREQLEAMALLSLNTQSVGFAVALLFFAVRASPWAISRSFPACFPRRSAC